MTLRDYLSHRSIQAEGGCIVWTGSKTKGGYGTVNFRGMKTTAHRAAYILRHGEPGPGMEIDHLCGNTLCVNQEHLEAVTHQENVDRSSIGNITRCINGHDFTPENTYLKRNGTKSCRACNATRQRELRQKNLQRYRQYDRSRKRSTNPTNNEART